MHKIILFINELPDLIMDDTKRYKMQFLGVYSLLGVVSLFMTILNIITHKGLLTYATGIFAILSIINILCELKGGKFSTAASYVFEAELIALFTFFIVSGNPDGFSALWTMIVPSCAMMLFGIKRGSYFCVIMLFVLIFFYWLPLGQSILMYSYTKTFMMRFPILYAAFSLLALALESISQTAFDKFKYMSKHDALTGAINRRGFADSINTQINKATLEKAGFIISDLDLFKKVNDTYGHFAGDEVLKETAQCLKEYSGLDVCRWGGEEFALFDPSGSLTQEKLSEIVKKFEEHKIYYKGIEIPITISMGGVVGSTQKYNVDEISKLADQCLYEAKANGRNQAVFKDLT